MPIREIKTEIPDYTGSKVGQTYGKGSIASNEINSDALDNNMTDSGGGVIA